MMDLSSVELTWGDADAEGAIKSCNYFLNSEPSKRFIFGRNVYARAVSQKVDVAGFIDDYTSDTEYEGRPIINRTEIPNDAVVLSASGGRPLTVQKLLDDQGIRNLDYFSLYKWGKLNLPEAVFNEGFQKEFDAHKADIGRVFSRLADEESREVLVKLLSFRYTYNLSNLQGFTERQTEQYFEPFFFVNAHQSVFVDVGGFDGFTSEEFIRRAPDYHAVYIFEPEADNRARCLERLKGFRNINSLPYGAGSENASLKFSSNGSGSAISDDGELEIEIRRIDDLLTEAPTFLKMDIEGAELMALDGARDTIIKYRPALAIAVYHRPSDIWSIPKKILQFYEGYKIYLRHYTESIYETVMYFIPPEYEVQ